MVGLAESVGLEIDKVPANADVTIAPQNMAEAAKMAIFFMVVLLT
jgi:hypothetical protein